jgi:hypothetical protein
MSPMLHRAAICAGIATAALPALSLAQSTGTNPPAQRGAASRRFSSVATSPIVQRSPNGRYELSVSDTGIVLSGPHGRVRITDSGIEIGSLGNGAVHIVTDAASITLDAGGSSIQAPRVMLGCLNGKPVARSGDAVYTESSPPMIGQGSSVLFAC